MLWYLPKRQKKLKTHTKLNASTLLVKYLSLYRCWSNQDLLEKTSNLCCQGDKRCCSCESTAVICMRITVILRVVQRKPSNSKATCATMNLLVFFFFPHAVNNTCFFSHLLFCSFSFLPQRYLSLARISPLLVSIVQQKNHTKYIPSRKDHYCSFLLFFFSLKFLGVLWALLGLNTRSATLQAFDREYNDQCPMPWAHI